MEKHCSTSISLQESLISAISLVVFSVLDLLDFLLCFVYRFLDSVFDQNTCHACYCRNGERNDGFTSETLYARTNIFRQILMKITTNEEKPKQQSGGSSTSGSTTHRWSDCGCEYCVSWRRKGEERLHLVVKEPAPESCQDRETSSTQNVIFLHGFLSSSAFWTETVFPNLSESANHRLRIFAVDLLGFGRSPKPTNSMYTIEEHVEFIERSVIRQFPLSSFHIVAHSMGCILAISLAAKHPELVKSITLIASPYFPSSGVDASYRALNRLAERKVWPPSLFGSSVMSWYEHLGRTVCLIVCRNHLIWEWILKLATRRRDVHFLVRDLTKHTHHSAWHTMHNVICGGAKLLDKYLEILKREEIPIKLIHGAKDQVVPLECSYNMKFKVPFAEVKVIQNANHVTVILGREKAFTRELEDAWFPAKKL